MSVPAETFERIRNQEDYEDAAAFRILERHLAAEMARIAAAEAERAISERLGNRR
jgi:hypothetical protein